MFLNILDVLIDSMEGRGLCIVMWDNPHSYIYDEVAILRRKFVYYAVDNLFSIAEEVLNT